MSQTTVYHDADLSVKTVERIQRNFDATDQTKLEQWVRSGEHQQNTRGIVQGFQPIPAPPEILSLSICHEMLGFVEEQGLHAPLGKSYFNGTTQFWCLIQRFGS